MTRKDRNSADSSQSNQAKNSQTTKIYSVLSPHKYVQNDQEKTAWTEVGVGFSSKDGEGVNISIKPGLSVSGRLVLKLWNNKDNKPESEPGQFIYDASMPRDHLV